MSGVRGPDETLGVMNVNVADHAPVKVAVLPRTRHQNCVKGASGDPKFPVVVPPPRPTRNEDGFGNVGPSSPIQNSYWTGPAPAETVPLVTTRSGANVVVVLPLAGDTSVGAS